MATLASSSSKTIDAMAMMDLGTHCKAKECNQLDFLPFKCNCCYEQFCSLHWRPIEGHACTGDLSKLDNRVPACPLCKQPVNIPSGVDPNIPMDRHLSTSCPILSPNGLIQKKPKSANCCKAHRCKTKMIVPIRCQTCKKDFCPTHRNPKDHACQTPTNKTTSTPSNSQAGLAAIRRVRAKANAAMTSTSNKPSSSATRVIIDLSDSSDDEAPVSQPLLSKSNKSKPAKDSDSDVEFVSHKAAPAKPTPAPGPKKQSILAMKLNPEERAKAKRIKAERQSALKALHVRAQKGLLSEKEKVDYATLRAAEARDGVDSDGCNIA